MKKKHNYPKNRKKPAVNFWADPEYRKKQSIAHSANTGKDGPNWRGGTTMIKDATYEMMFEKQKGLCAICGKVEIAVYKGKRDIGKVRKLCIDHNHETGKVRGLLCQKCNAGLGMFLDNVEFMLKAVAYLRVWGIR